MTVKEYAKQHGFATARKLKPWNGTECWEAVFSETEETSYIGYPKIILHRNGVFRFATDAEALAYIAEVDNG